MCFDVLGRNSKLSLNYQILTFFSDMLHVEFETESNAYKYIFRSIIIAIILPKKVAEQWWVKDWHPTDIYRAIVTLVLFPFQCARHSVTPPITLVLLRHIHLGMVPTFIYRQDLYVAFLPVPFVPSDCVLFVILGRRISVNVNIKKIIP